MVETLSTHKSEKKITVVGGGTGVFTVLTGLRNRFLDLTAVVTMADDGGSTGILREEFGILPPGDIRRALVALARSDNKILSELFNYRFEEGGGLAGHAFGNLMLAALERITGDFRKAIDEASKILGVQGKVLPVTLIETRLVSELADGRVIRGESNLDAAAAASLSAVKRVWLDPEASINPEVERAILAADAVVLAPGDLFTSLIPNLVVRGMREVLYRTPATVIYLVNLITKAAETAGFRASDFLNAIEQYVGKEIIDYVIINETRPSAQRLKPYILEKSEFVEPDVGHFGLRPTPVVTDLLRPRGLIRHDPEKVAEAIAMLI